MSSWNFTISVKNEEMDKIKEMLEDLGTSFEQEGMSRGIRLIIKKAWAHHLIIKEGRKLKE